MTEIVVALIGLLGVVVTALLGSNKIKKQKHRADQAEGEVKFQRAALNFGSFLEEWDETHKEIEQLLATTPIDRFLILRAWNGELSPRWTTAVFQMREGAQEPISYVHFELDNDYVDRLKEISVRNTTHLVVEDLPPSAIKDVYQAEGVKHAVWAHLSSEKIEGRGSVAHTYCSFATHEDEPLDASVVTKCSILAGRLKGVAMAFKD